MNVEFSTLQEIAQTAVDKLKDGIGLNSYGCDLHSELFNTDYFVIGYYEAEQWLIKNGGVFFFIGEIQEYEKSNFGEVYTDLSSSESVCNMAVYILGEVVLSELDTLRSLWDDQLTEEHIQAIIEDLESHYDLK